jgi:OPA family glycerol-3-phosphate transporter-like MFS transporter
MIFASLTTSALVNLIVAVTNDFEVIKWLWLLNGICMSVLWPTLIRMLSECLPQASLGKSSVAMGSSVALGTLIIYGLSALYASISKFRLSFYTAGFAILGVCVVWLCLYDKATSGAKAEREQEISAEPVAAGSVAVPQEKAEKKMLTATICALCFGAVGVNLIKDGLNTWVPSILKEAFGMKDWISILLTLFLPMLAVFGNATGLSVHKRIPDYVNHLSLVFAIDAVIIGVILMCLEWGSVVLMLACLLAAHFLISTGNSLLTSIFPMFMRGKVNSGMIAGVLNGFCYFGSTISSYGLGAIADHWGWSAVFWTLLGVCGAVCLVWCGYTLLKWHTNRRNV